jgi:uncharacterized protein (TIGR00299 family) protein
MKLAYFDCFAGAGGDMIVGALIDAGADADALRSGLSKLRLDGYSLDIARVTHQGFAASRFHVRIDSPSKQPHRHLAHVVEILNKSGLSDRTRGAAIRVFERLASAEAAVHGTTIDKVHFHEVGAVDAIVDVVGAVLGLELLGVERVFCSPVPLGSGSITCSHGVMPVPAPATAKLLEGVPVVAGVGEGELTTPTAAAVLTTLASEFGPIPQMTLASVGYGAGSREGQGMPNLLRVLVGTAATSNGDIDEITVLETSVDDATPEVLGYCMERLLSEGALDAYAVPIQMKKWRTGVLLTVLCRVEEAPTMERILFAESTTFGIRRRRTERVRLARRHESVSTAFGEVRMKIGEWENSLSVSPEFEDCRRAALKHQVPLREVIAAANAAWATRAPTTTDR